MMRRIWDRGRSVAPPGWSILFILLLFGIFGIPQLVFGQQPAQPANPPTRRCLVLAAIALGVYRVVAFHPYCRPGFLRWLKSTPWTVNKPLPLGPVELIPEDSLAIGLLIVLSTALPEPRCIEFVNFFLLSHIALLAATFCRTGETGFGYVVGLLLGFVALYWKSPWLALLILAGIYLVAHEGLWRALRRFPWETEGILVDLGMPPNETNPQCGWFFDRFHRDINAAKPISRIDALLCCLLGAWWLFVASSLIPDGRDRSTFLILCAGVPMIIAPLMRLVLYMQGCRAPISLLGRIVTLRWLIPGFDQVLVGPLLSLIACPVTVAALWNTRVPTEICWVLGATMTVLIALVCPPRLKRWRLTGQLRLAPTFAESQAATVRKTGQP